MTQQVEGTPQNPNFENPTVSHNGNLPKDKGGERAVVEGSAPLHPGTEVPGYVDSRAFTDEELALIEAHRAQRAASKYTTDESQPDPNTDTTESVPTGYAAKPASTESDETAWTTNDAVELKARESATDPNTSPAEEAVVPPRTTSRRGFLKAVGFGALGVAGIGTVTAIVVNGNKQPVANPPVESTEPKPAGAGASASESASSTPNVIAPVESDMTDAEKFIARKHEDFRRTGDIDQELGVDGVFLTDALGGPEGVIFNQAPYDPRTNQPIGDFNPMIAAAQRAANGESRPTPQDILNDIGAQGALNQFRFAYANLFGQRDGDIDTLDVNKGENMLASAYEDLDSPEAQETLKLIANQTTTEFYGVKDYWKMTSGSDELLSGDPHNLGTVKPYITINYDDERGDHRHIYLTPVESTFNGPSPYGKASDILTLEPTKWKSLKEGKGSVEIA